jgi:arylsulfatase A
MLRRHFLSSSAAAFARAATRPHNILLILADDLGIGDPACYNRASKIPMPNMNRFAAQGMRFTDMHSPSAVCTPTRYGLLTGRYAWRSSLKKSVLNGESPCLIETSRPTIASELRKQGYATGIVGKWHLGLGSAAKTDYKQALRPGPLDLGFDTWAGIPASLDMPPYVWVENDRVAEQPTNTIGPSGTPDYRGPFWRPGDIAPTFRHHQILERITTRAVDFLQQRQQSAQPWFLYTPLTGPHIPWLPNATWRGKSGAGEYGDFAMQTDAAIGRILNAVRDPNTLTIVTSDNGAYWDASDTAKFGHRANGPWRGMKADIYEGGHRVPFLARWPGRIKPRSVSSALASLIDLFPTLTDKAEHEDAVSLARPFRGEPGPRHELVMHSAQGIFGLRQGSWKLCEGRGSGGFSAPSRIKPSPGEAVGELYDLAKDPGETTNLYLQHPERVAALTQRLHEIRSRA